MFKNVSIVSLLFALAVCALAFNSAQTSFAIMTAKAQAQEQALASFRQWKADYDKLLPVAQQWQSEMPSIEGARDLYSLYRMLGEELPTNPDALIVTNAERLLHEGRDVGAHRVCFATLGHPGLLFEGERFSELYLGLTKLAERRDIQMRSATFTLHESRPRVVVHDFCLVLRDAQEPGAL